MKKSGLPSIAWVLLGLLGIAACLLSLGKQDNSAEPAGDSYGPSGISAFAEILQHDGLNISIDNSPKSRLAPGEVAIGFKVIDDVASKDDIVDLTGEDPKEDKLSPFEKRFLAYVRGGGTGILMPLKLDFLEASRSAKKSGLQKVTVLGNKAEFRISDSGLNGLASPALLKKEADLTALDLWTDSTGPFLRAFRVGKGTLFIVRDAIGITNRFVDQGNNAAAFKRIIEMAGGGLKPVVFTEASFGNIHSAGLLETIGAWANAAWQQLIFLGVVVIYTLGKRFGHPDETKTHLQGSREFLDALGETFKRARSTKTALRITHDQADIDVRAVLKLPKDAPRVERDRHLPESLQVAFARLLVNSGNPHIDPDHALALIVEMQKELDAFIGPHRAKLKSLAKLRT